MYHTSTIYCYLLSSNNMCYNIRMGKYSGYTPSRKKANDNYLNNKVDSIMVRVPKGQKERIQKAAEKKNKSLNEYCADAILESVRSDEGT